MRMARFATTAALIAGSLVVGGTALAPSAGADAPTFASAAQGTAIQPLLTCSYTNSRPTIGYGNGGAAVRQAQCELNFANHAGLSIDGNFGSQTQSATLAYQKRCGLTRDGIIGPNTWFDLDLTYIDSGYANCGID